MMKEQLEAIRKGALEAMPSMISKPMSRNTCLISSSTVYMGCLWPRATSLPGMVTSSVSAFSLASRAAFSRMAD